MSMEKKIKTQASRLHTRVKYLKKRLQVRESPDGRPGLTPQQLEKWASESQTSFGATVIDYGPDYHEARQTDQLNMLSKWVNEPKAKGAENRWINIDNINALGVMAMLSRRFQLHPLAIEDALNISQRAKVDMFGPPNPETANCFAVIAAIHGGKQDGDAYAEQISIFTGPGIIISLQEQAGDAWEAVRKRLKDPRARVRTTGTDYLLYALLDATVDSILPAIDKIVARIDKNEEEMLHRLKPNVLHDTRAIQHDLLLMRKMVDPIRIMTQRLLQDQDGHITDDTKIYLADVYDHAIYALENIDLARELTRGLADTWVGLQGHKMNQVMTALAIMSALFLPAGFLAGVFGMNFKRMPLLDNPLGFYIFLTICLGISAGMVVWFIRKRWVG